MTTPTGHVTHVDGVHRAVCAVQGCPWSEESSIEGKAAKALMNHNAEEHS